jgi:hypothetical protein
MFPGTLLIMYSSSGSRDPCSETLLVLGVLHDLLADHSGEHATNLRPFCNSRGVYR